MSNAAAETRPAPFAATSNQISWLALTLTPGLGPTRGKRLLEFFGSIEGVLNATLTELRSGRASDASRAVTRHRTLRRTRE
jgi:excinuclease UvrABC nuclease subunit